MPRKAEAITITKKSPKASRDTVVITKNDTPAEFGQRIKAGITLMLVAGAAAGTVYLFGDDLRDVVGTGLDWTVERMATWF